MSDRNLEFALRIKTEVSQARGDVEGFNTTLETTGKTAQGSNAAIAGINARLDAMLALVQRAAQSLESIDQGFSSLASSGNDAARANTTVAETAQQATTAIEQQSEAEAEASQRIQQMVSTSLEYVRAQNSARAASEQATVAQGRQADASDGVTDAIRRQNVQMTQTTRTDVPKAIDAQTAAMRELYAQIDPTITKLQRLDDLQEKLAAGRKSGLVDNEEFQRFNAEIETQRAGLEKADGAMHSLGLSSSMARMELGRLVKDMATGQWERFGQTSMTLANYSGVMGKMFTAAGIAIVGTTATLALFAAAAVKGYLEDQKLAAALIATGNAAGFSASQLGSMADEIGRSTGDYDGARQAVLAFTNQGKLSKDVLATASQAAVDFSKVTGQSMESAIKAISGLADDPVRAAQQLDEQYHFLSTSQLQQIMQLQEEGNATQAVAVAYGALADAMSQRSGEIQANLGYVQRTWNFIKEAGSYWKSQAMDIGAPASDDERLADMQRRANAWARQIETLGNQKQSKTGIDLVDNLAASAAKDQLDYARQEYSKAEAAYRAEEQRQKESGQREAAAGVATAVQTEGKAAAQRIDQLTNSLDKAKQRQDALNQAAADLYRIHLSGGKLPEGVNFDGAAADTPQGAGWEKIKAEINKRYADPKVKDTSGQLAADMKQLQDQILQLGNTALGPVSGIWDQYTKAMLSATTTGGKAIKAGGNVAEVQAMVSKIQDLAASARDKALADQRDTIQISLLQASGQTAEAAKLTIEKQYGDLLEDMKRRSDTAGVEMVQKLINVSEARAQLQQLQAEVDRVLSDQSRTESNIHAEQQAGLLSEYSARQKILDLHKATAQQLEDLLPKYRALADATGDPRAVQQVKDLEAQLSNLKLQADDLKVAFSAGLTSGLEQALEGIATRTMTVADAFKTLGRTVIASLAQVAARAIATKAIDAVGNLFGNSDQQADVGQGATKLVVAGSVVGAAATLMGTNADKLQAAATTLLIANSMQAGGGFAEGGWTGPGGKYQVAGVVHAGEYVQPQNRMSEPGALAFMHDFHMQGMSAIGAWAGVGYAEGGLVRPLSDADAPRLTAPRTSRSGMGAPSGSDSRGGMTFALRNINVVDPALVADYMDSSDGESKVMNIISRNESRLRQIVGRS